MKAAERTQWDGPVISPVPSNMVRPQWSVMIPVCNRLTYLRQALESVLDQDPGAEKMQICIVDNSTEVINWQSWLRPGEVARLEIYRQPLHVKMSENWNTCIEHSRGQWVHILHWDDYVLPGFYESLRHGVEAYPQVGAAYCRHAYCDENGHWHRLADLEMSGSGILQYFVETLVAKECIQCAAIVVKRSTYERVGGFNVELKHALDWEMWIRIASKFPIFYEPKILACWRNHPGATTSRQIRSGDNIRDIARAVGIWSRHLPAGESLHLSAIVLNRFAHVGLGLARQLLRQNDVEGSLNQVDAALLCKTTFRLQLSATKIRIKARAKKILNRLRRS